jgi:hypothetical protein
VLLGFKITFRKSSLFGAKIILDFVILTLKAGGPTITSHFKGATASLMVTVTTVIPTLLAVMIPSSLTEAISGSSDLKFTFALSG